MAEPEITVAHRDEHLLILVKPPFLQTTAPGGGDCLARRAPGFDPHAPRLHPSSRLDAEVSGLVTFARTRRATQALLDARRRGQYGRLYLGLVTGVPVPAEGEWQGSIAIDPQDKRRRIVSEVGIGRRNAQTNFRLAAQAEGAALMHLRPVTGRTHQLRVHAAEAGIPLLGDVHYGGPRRVVRGDGRVVSARRVMLHCAVLEVPDVARGGSLRVSAALPEDMELVWAGLGGAADALRL